MCYSVLQASFRNDKAKQVYECQTEADERTKIKDLFEKDQVMKVAVYRCHRHVVREEKITELPYTAPVEVRDGG